MLNASNELVRDTLTYSYKKDGVAVDAANAFFENSTKNTVPLVPFVPYHPNSTTNTVTAPQTGDDAPIGLLVALALSSLCLLGFLSVKMFRRDHSAC